ncbi:MAG: 3-hydroxyacyl-CoA dehydrogenase [Rhodospirillaceae bacterium]|nr:3-hydroxyacyl-CoA dehydrogenase [Rhodospirillaceae bacterium]|tara:strand:+ start:96 stop:857 length:762 start_codon:yes stop_codon:yes gene_type:complete
MDIAGHAALVTGAASGLGAATAKALADAGAKVACLDLNLEGAEKVASAIGGKAFQADVTQAASLEKAVADAAAAQGPARIAVSCAGIAPPKRIVGRDGPQALETFAQTIQVNLIGTFNLLRLAAHGMQGLEALETGERGVIVNTASVAAFEGQIGQAAYAASKGGVASMTLPAAREFAKSGIRVMTIAPGVFKTPMVAALSDEVQASLAAGIPFPSRLGDPAEYADLVLAICGNVMLNGEVIRLDGAIRMQPI